MQCTCKVPNHVKKRSDSQIFNGICIHAGLIEIKGFPYCFHSAIISNVSNVCQPLVYRALWFKELALCSKTYMKVNYLCSDHVPVERQEPGLRLYFEGAF